MSVLRALLWVYVVAALGYWGWAAWCAFRTLRGVPLLRCLQPPEPQRWPRLSVIVPACNEERDLGDALRTLLAEDYPDLEVVAVDDRSTDGTGAIIDRVAASDDRLKALHLAELPEGWLGKPHALRCGLRESTGDFVLFTDADVRFASGTLRTAVAHCIEHRIDHLTAFPDVQPHLPLLDDAMAMFVRQNLIVNNRPWAVRDPRSGAYLGIGAFNLVRRSAFERTEGLEWLRMEVAEDLGVGLMMKRSGARCDVVGGYGSVGLQWYRSLAEAARGGEKAYAAAGYNILRALGIAPSILAVELAPAVGPMLLAWPAFRSAGFVGMGVLLAYLTWALLLRLWAGDRLLPALFGPLTAPVFVALFLRACVLGWLRGGITWRGTTYVTADLRQGRRVRFP